MAIPFITIVLDKPYRLRFGMGTQIEFEQISGMKVSELGEELEKGASMSTLSNVLWAMMRRENKDLTLASVCDLVDDNSDHMTYISDKICEAITAAYEVKNLPNVQAPEMKIINND